MAGPPSPPRRAWRVWLPAGLAGLWVLKACLFDLDRPSALGVDLALATVWIVFAGIWWRELRKAGRPGDDEP